jgi:hypothetical protein
MFVFFAPRSLVVYVLALFSIRSLQRMLGHTLWPVMRTVGMTYIAHAFAVDFLSAPFSGDMKRNILYAPFAILSVTGPMLHAVSLIPALRRAYRAPS